MITFSPRKEIMDKFNIIMSVVCSIDTFAQAKVFFIVLLTAMFGDLMGRMEDTTMIMVYLSDFNLATGIDPQKFAWWGAGLAGFAAFGNGLLNMFFKIRKLIYKAKLKEDESK
jgi:hypothetical protein|tara:strand:+ start:479 stop:817 length:339 start_codon:yes stop_codon:yes gene_type:complete